MLFKDFKLISGLVTDLEYESDDIIEWLSPQQHDTIYQLIHAESSDLEINWKEELVELMRMLILTPSVEAICNKWLRLTGNATLWNICQHLTVKVYFLEDWFATTDQRAESTTRNAAWYEQLNCLKYAHEQGCPWDESTTSHAASNGHLACLRYLHEQGCPWDESTTYRTASNGHLDCLKYAHEQGCPWDESTTRNAAWYGHFNCLKYAHEQGCPWDESTTRFAAYNGHEYCLKYARENGCP